MAEQPTFSVPFNNGDNETTGRYIVTFRDDSVSEGLGALKKHGGVSKLASAADFPESAVDFEKAGDGMQMVFPTLGLAVVSMEDEALASMATVLGEDSAILDIEPERIFYALANGSDTATYLKGYRDAVNSIYDRVMVGGLEEEVPVEIEAAYFDDAQSTWGLKATRAVNSRYTGRGIKVAVLDTGLDLRHPDFRGRSITSKSFIAGENVQDGNGHGTHCIGTACGGVDMNGRRFGVARDSQIYAGKVLSNGGSGPGAGILAGMEWAITNGCQVISMSLGNNVPTPSTAYEAAGRRALQNGTLIVAASGNGRRQGHTVGQPANSSSILAVAAIDSQLRLAPFSSGSGQGQGAKVDIAGPGVQIYSTVPMPRRYDGTFNGTSMATPHVAGIAALWAEANRARGFQLWQLLVSRARTLAIPTSDVGSGLVQAPS